MIKNPILNAFIAAAYIAAVATITNTLSTIAETDKTMLLPLAFLSLLVLSVATMILLFIWKPVQLFFEDKKQEALNFFMKTIAAFACFVAILVISILFVLN